MNSKFLKFALCLGLFAGAMNNPSLSMESTIYNDSDDDDNEIFGQKLVDADEAFKEQTKTNSNLYEKNIEVDLFKKSYTEMTNSKSDMSLESLNKLIKQTESALDMKNGLENLEQILNILSINNEFLPKAKSFYHDVYDSYNKIRDMFNKENKESNACVQKYNELSKRMKDLNAQAEILSGQIRDLQEKREYIKNGYIECLYAIEAYRKEKGKTVGQYQKSRGELSNLTKKLKDKADKIMNQYNIKAQALGKSLKQYSDNESVLPNKEKKKKIGSTNKSVNQLQRSNKQGGFDFGTIKLTEKKDNKISSIDNNLFNINEIPSNQLDNRIKSFYEENIFGKINENKNEEEKEDNNINNEQPIIDVTEKSGNNDDDKKENIKDTNNEKDNNEENLFD